MSSSSSPHRAKPSFRLESEAWFQALAETIPAAICVFRERFLYFNVAFEQLTGYSRQQLLEMRPIEVIHPDHREFMEQRRRDRLQGLEVPRRYEAMVLTRDGEERWIDYTGSRIDIEGEPCILGTAFDITATKLAELARAQSEERLLLAQKAAGVFSWDWNLLTDELIISESAGEALGLGRGLLPSSSLETFHRLTHPEDKARTLEATRRAIKEGGVYSVERRLLTADGGVRWLAERGKLIRDESGWAVRMAGVSIDITERKQVEIALQDSNERLRLMVEQLPAVLWSTDRQLRFTSCMGAGLQGLGLKPNAMMGMHITELIEPSRNDQAFRAHQGALGGESVSYEYTWGGRFFQSHVKPLRDSEGEIVGCVGLGLDVTENRQAEAELHREREQAQVTLSAIDDGVVRTDAQGRVEYMNSVAEQCMGLSLKEAKGRLLDELYRVIDEASGKPLLNPVNRVLKENRKVMLPGHRVLLGRDGSELTIRDSASPIRSREGALIGAVLAFKNVTAVRDMEREMVYLANHDGLTGLLNRHAFELRLSRALERTAEEGAELSVVQLDIAQFKVINDTCGHLAGDEALKSVARRLRAWEGEKHAIARLGVDEFGVLFEGLRVEEARRKAEELNGLLEGFRFTWQDRSFDLQIHFGLVSATPGDSVSGLMIALDIACLLAKESGHNEFHEYQADDERLEERYREMHWIHRIHRALDEDSFRLYCQPIQRLDGKEEGFLGEALLRMVDEEGELVLPQTFLPVAERYRLISPIDRWVVRESFKLLAGGATVAGHPVERLAINISGESLGDAPFLDYVVGELETSGVRPDRVLLEITETAAIANLDGAMRFIAEVRKRGVCLVLDDFGSGLSSFAYLANLPVDYLKIAGEFLRSIETSPMNLTLVRSIHQISRELGLETIAEGVETEAVYRLLEDIEIDYAQGYWIAHPVPLQGAG